MARRPSATKTEIIDVEGIRVELTRKSVRNLNLRVRKDGTVAASVAPQVPTERVVQFVASKRAWIEQAQDRMRRKQQRQATACHDGSELSLWGTKLVCRLVPLEGTAYRSTCTFEVAGSTLLVRCGELYLGDDDPTQMLRDAALWSWLKETLRNTAVDCLRACEELVGRSAGTLRLRRMTSRWGSCNVKTAAITLNTELVHYPPACLRYVIIHELCHLYEPNHGERFHALMDRFCPGWKTQKDLLEAKERR